MEHPFVIEKSETDAILEKHGFSKKDRAFAMTVYSTIRYEKFSHIKGNRQVVAPHLKKLIVSIEEEYLISIIVVNEHLEVIDGRHRLAAAEDSQLPVYFVIVPEYGIKQVQRMNVHHKNWTTVDFMNTYIDQGNQEYVKYRDFKLKFPFNHTVTMILLKNLHGRTQKMNDEFREGRFAVGDIELAEENAKKLKQLEKHLEFANKTNFIQAFLQISENPLYDHEHFLKKVETKGMSDAITTETFMRKIEELFNLHRRPENRVRLWG